MMTDRASLTDFMQDARYREELLVRFQSETQICWWDSLNSTEPLQVEYSGERMGGKKWCEGNAFVSPRGSFIVTLHPGRGVQLWGGLDFERKARFLHSNVKDVLFAPDEEHVLVIGSDVEDPEAVKLFRVLTGELVRVFPHGQDGGFQWSGSGRLLGRILEKTLIVYGGAEFKPMVDAMGGGKLVTAKYVNCTQFAFAPTGWTDMVAVWTSEGANVPARLAVVEIVGGSWREVGSKTYFSTEGEMAMEWSLMGSLVVKTSRLLKKAGTTKKIGTSIDLFSCGGTCSSYSIDLGVEGTGLKCVRTFGADGRSVAALWEKQLVMYKTDKEKGLLVEQARVSLAGVGGSGGGCMLEKMAVSQFGYAVLYGSSGDLVFVSLTTAEILRVDQHYLVNRVEFDPSGRFVLTAVVQKMHDDSSMAFRYQQEAGFAIWTFQGRPLHKWKKERLYNVQWRPHAVSLLDAEEKKKILSELKLRERKIEEEEEAIRGQSRDSVERSITEKRNSFYAALAKVDAFFKNSN